MKLLTVGDLHYNIRQFDWLLQCAEQYEAVIIAGDLLNIAGYVDVDTQILVVRKYLQRLKERTTVMVCSGNHDLDEKDPDGEFHADWLRDKALDGLHGDGAGCDLAGWHFSLCPWWDGPAERRGVGEFIQSEARRGFDRWIVVHHAPPSGTRTAWSGKREFGDDQLRSLIEEHPPQIVLSGHVHQAPFRQEHGWYDRIGETWVFNAGFQIGPIPACLVFDLEAGEVTWTSLAGRETVSL